MKSLIFKRSHYGSVRLENTRWLVESIQKLPVRVAKFVLRNGGFHRKFYEGLQPLDTGCTRFEPVSEVVKEIIHYLEVSERSSSSATCAECKKRIRMALYHAQKEGMCPQHTELLEEVI